MKVVHDPARNELLLGWLRRGNQCARAQDLVLRGSLMLGAVCPGARPPMDVDYLVPGLFNAQACEQLALEIAAQPDVSTHISLERCVVIFGETQFPGLRAFVRGESAVGPASFQVDFGFGDPLSSPAVPVVIPRVGSVLACTLETLFGWKLHGLVEFGRGRWHAKDLFDLWLIWTAAQLDIQATRAAVELAFSSRFLGLDALDDFRTRPSWGESRSGQKKWRSFRNKHRGAPDFTVARSVVRQAVNIVLG
ncbi:MAG: nucleotidyl transferase AbiEii/AbiGii toxin family protein [Polyangiaceae bacterium]|nr:nucleotidyl transferase AbiEii/AbiGii toxin family protein [Polyangiaceae bacterium]